MTSETSKEDRIEPRFLQIHTLHTYPAALVNRDDAGLAKRLPLGNAVRTRISSQCLKRHWRVADDRYALSALGVPMADRSRVFFERIGAALVAEGVSEALAGTLAAACRDAFTKDLTKLIKEAKKAKPKKAKAADGDPQTDEQHGGDMKQAILLGRPEYDYLEKLCLEVAKDADTTADNARLALFERLKKEQSNFKRMTLDCGLESALFGRMVTSDLLAARDAAIYVSHAFTVHQAQVENDYFTVVDDLLHDSGELGSAGIFDTELASGLYYGYVVVDVRQLVENLEGIDAKDCFAESTPPERRELAARVVQHLLHLIATVSPGAKRGSTAPFDWAKLMLVEAGDWQPRSLAGAFHDALPLSADEPAKGLRQRAVERLDAELVGMDEAYGAPMKRFFLATEPVEISKAQRIDLAGLADWAGDAVKNGKC